MVVLHLGVDRKHMDLFTLALSTWDVEPYCAKLPSTLSLLLTMENLHSHNRDDKEFLKYVSTFISEAPLGYNAKVEKPVLPSPVEGGVGRTPLNPPHH